MSLTVADTIADYEEVLANHRRLVRELDVLLNGEAGAAKQASLADIVSQVSRMRIAEWSKASAFYRQCRADPNATDVGAMRDAIEWLCTLAEQST